MPRGTRFVGGFTQEAPEGLVRDAWGCWHTHAHLKDGVGHPCPQAHTSPGVLRHSGQPELGRIRPPSSTGPVLPHHPLPRIFVWQKPRRAAVTSFTALFLCGCFMCLEKSPCLPASFYGSVIYLATRAL